MSQELADYVRQHHEHGRCKTIAVSDAFKIAPWASALVSNDRAWWENNKPAYKFAGRKFAAASFSGVECLRRDGIYNGGINSGLQAMRAAQLLGATKIILLGFDMRGGHYFGPHPHPLKNTTAKRFLKHIEQFKKWRGCPVMNCTPGSALKQFPMSTIERELPALVKPESIATVANHSSALISDKHRSLYLDYYASRYIPPHRSRWLDRVEALAKQVGARTILDYGCGAGRGISSFSQYQVADYDPGVPGCAGEPSPADLVVSIHALEHVEPEYVDLVIEHMKGLATKALFIVVSCEPSTKLLPNGGPWHSFVRSADWWREKLESFDSQPVIMDRPGAEYAALLLKIKTDELKLRMSA
jgi:hypothetical protein